MSIFAFRPKPVQLLINQLITLILIALSGCSLVQKAPLFAFLASSIKFTSGVITPAAAKFS